MFVLIYYLNFESYQKLFYIILTSANFKDYDSPKHQPPIYRIQFSFTRVY